VQSIRIRSEDLEFEYYTSGILLGHTIEVDLKGMTLTITPNNTYASEIGVQDLAGMSDGIAALKDWTGGLREP
jgi:hypothetical protein